MYVKQGLDCVELQMGDGKVERLWVRIRDEQIKGMSFWESITDHLARMTMLMNYYLWN